MFSLRCCNVTHKINMYNLLWNRLDINRISSWLLIRLFTLLNVIWYWTFPKPIMCHLWSIQNIFGVKLNIVRTKVMINWLILKISNDSQNHNQNLFRNFSCTLQLLKHSSQVILEIHKYEYSYFHLQLWEKFRTFSMKFLS